MTNDPEKLRKLLSDLVNGIGFTDSLTDSHFNASVDIKPFLAAKSEITGNENAQVLEG